MAKVVGFRCDKCGVLSESVDDKGNAALPVGWHTLFRHVATEKGHEGFGVPTHYCRECAAEIDNFLSEPSVWNTPEAVTPKTRKHGY